jgi:hypothetical protein
MKAHVAKASDAIAATPASVTRRPVISRAIWRHIKPTSLEEAQLTTMNDFKLADGSTVGPAPGGQVMLAPKSAVRVDLSSTANVAGFVNSDTHSTTAPPPVSSTAVGPKSSLPYSLMRVALTVPPPSNAPGYRVAWLVDSAQPRV